MIEPNKQKKATTPEPVFSKEQLLASNRFQDRRDLLEALLDEKKTYTMKAVEETITKYMKGKVN